MYTVLVYQTVSGKQPFLNWLNDLSDLQARAKIRLRIDRLEMGNFGNQKFVGEGVYELKIDFGPGYRIYYGTVGKTCVVLLCGGSKRSQNGDIKTAKVYFKDYKERGG